MQQLNCIHPVRPVCKVGFATARHSSRPYFSSSRDAPPKRWHIAAQASQGAPPVSKEEEEANKARWQESGGGQGSSDEWRWTLNWDSLPGHPILIGSCPRSPSDIDRIVEEGRATAILSLQSDACLEALGIDYPALHARACARGLLAARVAVRDFDHDDQAAMLPEAVRALHTLLAMGHRVYVHCTAGINRATLTTVGYLTFVQGLGLEEALRAVREARPQAHPYVDCWRTVRRRLVEGRGDEVGHAARAIFNTREQRGRSGSSSADWAAAEEILIRRTFQRQVAATLSIVKSMQRIAEMEADAAQEAAQKASTEATAGQATSGIGQSGIHSEASQHQGLPSTLLASEEEAVPRPETVPVPRAFASQCAEAEGRRTLDSILHAEEEVAKLRAALEALTESAQQLLSGERGASDART
ncbi:hypothetical protein ACKKBF_B12105 [Auxenochlorella protothecoides x Auxenochlorella symbiontica]